MLPLEELVLEEMANGETSLRLTERVGYDQFPQYAKQIRRNLGIFWIFRADAVDIRIRYFIFRCRLFALVFDDWPYGVTIEPQMKGASSAVDAIRARLLAIRDACESEGKPNQQ